MTLSNPSNATLAADPTATGTIVDDDDAANVAPAFTSAATFTPAENQTCGGVHHGGPDASDPDMGDEVTGYALSGGADQARRGSTSGVLTFQAAPNYEDPEDADTDNAYLVEVQATSGTGDREQTGDPDHHSDGDGRGRAAGHTGEADAGGGLGLGDEPDGALDEAGAERGSGHHRLQRGVPRGHERRLGDLHARRHGVARTITGLTASTSYQVRVQALNGETPSAWSDPSDAVTPNAEVFSPHGRIGGGEEPAAIGRHVRVGRDDRCSL